MKPGQTIIHLAGAWLLCAAAMAQSSRTGHERMLPGRVLASVTVHDVQKVGQRWRNSSDKDLSEVWAPFLNHLDSSRPEISDRLRNEVGLSLDEFREVGIGQLTIASVKIPDRPVAIVAMVDFQSRYLMTRMVTRLTTALLSSRFTLSRYFIGGACVSQFRREQRFRELAVCVNGSVLCLSTDSTVLRELLCRCRLHSPVVMPPRGYAEVVKHCETDGHTPLLTWYVDPIGLFRQLVLDTEQDESDFRSFLLNLIPQTGLDKLVAIGGTLDAGVADFATVSRTQIVMEQPCDGVLGLVRLQPDNLSPPTWISTSATSYKSVHWDLQSFYDGANRLLSIVEGEDALGQYVKRISTVKNGFNIKQDLLDQLTGRIYFTNRIVDGEQQHVAAIQVRNSAGVAEFLQKAGDGTPLFGASPATVSQVGHLTVYTQPLGDTQICIALIDDTLVFAATKDAMAILSNDADLPLQHSDEYQTVARFFGDQCLMQSFDSANDGLRVPYTFLRSQTSPEDTFGIDLSRLPPFEEFRRTLGPSGACAVQNESGVLFTHFSLHSIGENPAPRIAAAQD